MTASNLSGLRSVELGVVDVPAAVRFYTDIWGLAPAARAGESIYLRSTGPAHHVVALHPRARAEMLGITFTARSRAHVELLYARVRQANVAADAPGPIAEPGGGFGFTLRDLEGRAIRIVADDARHADANAVADRPHELAHVVLNAVDVAGTRDLFVDVLGFRLTDQTRHMDFITCNDHHHNIAFARGEAPTLNHIAFEMRDLESVMRGAGRLRDHGYAIEWGVGRHGPGNNVFAYFIGPEAFVIEYTAEVQRIDARYRVGKPDDWQWPPGRIDHWGISDPPSERMKAAQQKIRFADATKRA